METAEERNNDRNLLLYKSMIAHKDKQTVSSNTADSQMALRVSRHGPYKTGNFISKKATTKVTVGSSNNLLKVEAKRSVFKKRMLVTTQYLDKFNDNSPTRQASPDLQSTTRIDKDSQVLVSSSVDLQAARGLSELQSKTHLRPIEIKVVNHLSAIGTRLKSLKGDFDAAVLDPGHHHYKM